MRIFCSVSIKSSCKLTSFCLPPRTIFLPSSLRFALYLIENGNVPLIILTASSECQARPIHVASIVEGFGLPPSVFCLDKTWLSQSASLCCQFSIDIYKALSTQPDRRQTKCTSPGDCHIFVLACTRFTQFGKKGGFFFII